MTPPILEPEEHPDQRGLDETTDLVPERPRRSRESGPDARHTRDRAPTLEDDLEAIRDELPGGEDVLDERLAAVRACYEYLRERGRATKSDFTENVYPENSAGYESAGGWWNAVGKSGLRALSERRENVRPPAGEGAHLWRYNDTLC